MQYHYASPQRRKTKEKQKKKGNKEENQPNPLKIQSHQKERLTFLHFQG